MVFDDIVIGSGLAALGTVLGLPERRRVLVLAGERSGPTWYYDASGAVPCARLATGGLGEFWHGVIPTSTRDFPSDLDPAAFAALAEHFYPGTGFAARLGQSCLFVPRRPIRPVTHWRGLLEQRAGALSLVHEPALKFDLSMGGARVQSASGTHQATRLWVAAGVLHTPALLDSSLGIAVSRPTVSDHAICYLGLLDREAHPEIEAARVQRMRHGTWFECRLGGDGQSVNTLRPARFDFRRLDAGINERSAFGLPMGGALAKIAHSASPGLVSEALYNKFGWFARARMYGVYAQVNVPGAYLRVAPGTGLEPRSEVIRAAIARARALPAWPQLIPSQLPNRFIQGIHLHGSVDAAALRSVAGAEGASPLRVVDASIYPDVGPEHHSFKIMAAAQARAAAS